MCSQKCASPSASGGSLNDPVATSIDAADLGSEIRRTRRELLRVEVGVGVGVG